MGSIGNVRGLAPAQRRDLPRGVWGTVICDCDEIVTAPVTGLSRWRIMISVESREGAGILPPLVPPEARRHPARFPAKRKG